MKSELVFFLALVLAGSFFAQSTNASNDSAGRPAMRASEWGPTVNGLRCRLTLPAAIEQGMNIPATLELQADPAKLPASMQRLNSFMRDTFLTITLTDAGTGKQFAIKPFFYEGPPAPHTDRDLLALNQPLKPWTVDFPLVTVYSNLAPADYVCQATFAFPANHSSRVLASAASGSNWWRGTLVSGTVRLQVLPETPKFQTFWIPKRLVVTKELTNLHPSDQPPLLAAVPVIRFQMADAQTVHLPVRNGHVLCTEIDGHRGQKFSGGQALIPDDINPIDEWFDYKGQDLAVDYRIDVYEVEPTGDLHRMGPGALGYRSFWSRTFHVSVSGKQFRKMPATVVNVPSGSGDRECVALIRANSEVEELSLAKTGIKDTDMALIRRLRHLRVLYLFNTDISDAGLAQLQKMTGLQTLNLAGTKVTDSGVLGLRRLTRLEKFGLGNTSVTDKGAAVVSAFPHLRQLDFWNTRVGDATTARLSSLKQLEWLDLRGTRVTNKGVQDLTNLVHLHDLRLPATVTDNGS